MPFVSSTVLAEHRTRPRRAVRVAALVAVFAMVAGLAVTVAMGSSNAAVTLGPNLLNNSGFSDGTSGWAPARRHLIHMSVVGNGAFDSAHSVRLVTSGTANARLDDDESDWPRVKAGPFVATAWVRARARTADGVIRIREWNGSRVVHTESAPFTANGTWQRVYVRDLVQRGGSRLQVSVIFPDLAAGIPVQVDRVMLRSVLAGDRPDVVPAADPTTDPGDQNGSGGSTGGGGSGGGTTATLFGASVWSSGTTWTSAVAASDQRYGRLDAIRVYYAGMPDAWPGKAGSVNRPVVVSFKEDPRTIVSGADDAFFTTWFADAPRDRDVWWTLWHEPEDNVEAGQFTAAQYRDAIRHLSALAAQAGNPKLHTTVILMCWTLAPASGRSFSDFFPGSDVVDTIGWDCYSHPKDPTTYEDPAQLLGDAVQTSKDVGVHWAVAETGATLANGDSGAKRATWLHDVASYAANHGAQFVTYFDSVIGADYRLLDPTSQQAWHDVVTSS